MSDRKKARKLSQRQFGREAKKYGVSKVHSNETDLQFVHNFIDPKSLKIENVLDIATGAGHLAHTLAKSVEKVIASDITEEMLHETNRLTDKLGLKNITTKLIDVHDIPFENESFDLCTSRIAPHHFYDINTAFAEMARITRSRGFVFIQDTIAPENNDAAKLLNKIEKLRDESHIRDLKLSEWMTIFEENNVEVLKFDTREKDWPLKWWTERMSTPKEKVKEIISILEEIYDSHKDTINIRRNEPYQPNDTENNLSKWSIHPRNVYILGRKI